jgi:tRNA A-37 threonylcarbamoyl transferase component Bud32
MVDGLGDPKLVSKTGEIAAVGTTVAGRYRIEAVIDEGGEAVVYAARHDALGKRVALKVLHAGPARTKSAAERFLARVKLAASLNGPHVNRISDFGESSDTSFVVMDWLEGETLAAFLEKTESLSLDEALDIAMQVASALETAHAKGVVHGGLGAKRVFCARQGDERRMKVLGFGERADEEGNGVRADVHGFGELLLELVSRARFDAVTTFAVRRQREPELTHDLGQKVRKLPAALQAVVVKSLALETKKTYRNVADVTSDLERFRSGEIPDALLEMIASGSWALIPEESKSAAKVERAVAARREAAPRKGATKTSAQGKPAPKRVPADRHRQAAIVGVLVAVGLVAGWVASGLLLPDDVVVSAATPPAHPMSSELRAFGPDE